MAGNRIEIDPNGVKRVVQNSLPVPSSDVGVRNADARFYPSAGVAYKVTVTVGGVDTIIASGTSAAKAGRKFCLQVCTRVTDDSSEPTEVAAEETPHG